MRYLLTIDDRSAGVLSTTAVTREQAIAIMAMAPDDAVELDGCSARHLGASDHCDVDPLIAFISRKARFSARRSTLMPQLQAIKNRQGVPADR